MFQLTDDLRIAELRPLVSPAILMEELPISEEVSNLVAKTPGGSRRHHQGGR